HPVQPGRHPGRRSAGDRRAWRLCRGWRTQHRRPDQRRAALQSGGRATYLGDGLRLLPSAVLPGRSADRSHQHRHILDVLSSASEHRERGLGDLHVLRVVASTDANAADNLVAEFERISTTKNDEPIDARWRAGSQGRIVLDELVPGVGGHAKSGRRIRFVLRDLHAQQWCTVHPAERLQDAALIDNCDGERMAHLRRVSLRRLDQSMRQFTAYALFAEGVCHLCLSSNWLAAKTLLQGLNLRKSNKIKELDE